MGSSSPLRARPSTVRTSWPPAIAASTVQDLTGSPSSQTTHVPQLLVSQPQWVPVRPRVSRRKWTSSSRPSISRVTSTSLTVIVTCIGSAPRPLDGLTQGPSGQLVREVALVLLAAALVGDRVAAARRDLAGPLVELLVGRLPAQRGRDLRDSGGIRPHGRETDPRIDDGSAVTQPDRGAGRHDRPVAGPPLDLLVGAAVPGAARETNLDQDLAVPDRRLVRPDVELLHRDDALGAARTADHAVRVQGRAHRRQVLARVGLAERSAERSPVAHDRVGDHPLGLPEDREGGRELVRFEQLAVPGERADADRIVLDPDISEF